jgi:hypothetical protein
MKNQKFAVTYIDTLSGIKSSESINPAELKFFLQDERNGEIVITEILQSFDDWDTCEVLYTA